VTSILEYELEEELEQLDENLLPAQEAEPEIIGPDTRVKVTHTLPAPFRYICNLELDIPSIGSRAMCSGTLIGPSTVLTAGHCLSGFNALRMRVIPGRNGTLEPLPATRAASFQIAAGFAPTTPTDYGVIQLRDPIGIQIGFWSVRHRLGAGDPIGTSISAAALPIKAGELKVNLSGYPADKPGESRFGCIDRTRPKNRCFHSALSNPHRSRLCGTEQWRAFDRTVQERAGILEYLDDTCPGHSGSPVWVRRDPSLGGRVLVAIHVSGDRPPLPVANGSVRITPRVFNDIQRWLATAPVPPPFRVLDRFGFDKAALQAFHLPLIEQTARRIASRLASPLRIRTVFLVGHADSRGSAAYNTALGQRRALAVRTALALALDRLRPGLSRSVRFVVQSLGATQPTASTLTPAGRAQNRRVEIFLGRI
jgi:V8-like Glu-specific endopeptidase/outer membrane protein OmpA-like peptidoglycan-associated protein